MWARASAAPVVASVNLRQGGDLFSGGVSERGEVKREFQGEGVARGGRMAGMTDKELEKEAERVYAAISREVGKGGSAVQIPIIAAALSGVAARSHEEIDRLRAALRSIIERHDHEDKGEGFTRGGGLAWAMADDARTALGLAGSATPSASQSYVTKEEVEDYRNDRSSSAEAAPPGLLKHAERLLDEKASRPDTGDAPKPPDASASQEHPSDFNDKR